MKRLVEGSSQSNFQHMAIPLLAIGIGLMAAAGAAKSIHGANQAKQGRRMAAQNIRPEFEIQPEFIDNQALAASLAQSGLPESSLQYYTSNLERGLSSGTSAMLQAGGGPNAVSGLFDQYQQGLSGIAAADAQAKVNNIRYFIDRNRDLAEQRTMQWSLNKYEPYKDTARTAAQLQATGTENIFSGVSQIGSSLASGSKAGLFQSATPVTQPQANSFDFSNAGVDATMMTRQQMIDQSLDGMENSAYRDLIQQKLRQDYGIYDPGTVG